MATLKASNSKVKGSEKSGVAKIGVPIIHCFRASKVRWASECHINWSFLSNKVSGKTTVSYPLKNFW